MRATPDGTVAIDTSFLETRMAELGLKQYWLAEQLGVSPRTVLRWVNGQVRRLQGEHLTPLAQLLRCREEDLTPLGGEAAVLVDDRRSEAARMTADDAILTLLTPSATYPGVDALIKASSTPGLAPHTLGKLYNMLSMAVGRDFRIADAIVYAGRAEGIGRELANQVMVVRAWFAEGWARLYAGEVRHARRLFQRCIDECDYLDEQFDCAMAYFGLGSCQGYELHLDAALASLEESVGRMEPLDRPRDLALLLYVTGMFQVEAGRLDEARVSLVRSLDLATRVRWRSGIARATASLAEVAARRGDPDHGVELYDRALTHLDANRFVHPHVYLSGARVCQLAGDFDRALAEVDRGLVHAEQFRPEKKGLERLRADLVG